MTEVERSRAARAAAEAALVRVVHNYGARPEFVVLGGLVPELLCAGSGWRHVGTTDVDVQVDLEVAAGAVSAARLEQALVSAGFQPDSDRVWRWIAEGHSSSVVVKFELLTDLDDQPEGATIHFDGWASRVSCSPRLQQRERVEQQRIGTTSHSSFSTTISVDPAPPPKR